jgi:lipase
MMSRCLTRRDFAKPSLAYCERAEGETVLLLHGSGSRGAVWRQLMDALQPLYRVVAPDLTGYGGSAAWPASAPFGLHDEIRALQLLPCCAGKFYLVGYSYGGLVACCLALVEPARVLSLTLVEPMLFAALRYSGDRTAYDALRSIQDQFTAAIASGNRGLAMGLFIDFWAGAGSWMALPVAVRRSMLGVANKIELDWQASFAADPGAPRLSVLAERTLLVRGERSPEPVRCLVDALHAFMPGSARAIVPGVAHLIPLTHPAALFAVLMQHLHAAFERRMR